MIEVKFAVRAFAGFLCAFRVESGASCGKNGKAPRVELVQVRRRHWLILQYILS